MLPHLSPVAPNAALSSTPTAQHLSAGPLLYPAAARRRALAVMLHEHHREPDNLDAPARCTGTTSVSGQPITAQAAPNNNPGLQAPKRNARHPSVAASSQAVVHRRIAAGHLDWRPHVVCVNRAAGIVAPSPFHAPAVPFAAAAIPPHSQATLNPLHPPHPAAFCGRVLRLSPPVTPAKRRAIFFNQSDCLYQSRPPNPRRDLFDPTLHSGSTRQGVR